MTMCNNHCDTLGVHKRNIYLMPSIFIHCVFCTPFLLSFLSIFRQLTHCWSFFSFFLPCILCAMSTLLLGSFEFPHCGTNKGISFRIFSVSNATREPIHVKAIPFLDTSFSHTQNKWFLYLDSWFCQVLSLQMAAHSSWD